MKKIITLVITLVLAISLCACGGDTPNDPWPTSGLGAKLPKPDKGTFDVNAYSTSVSIDINGITQSDFTNYVTKCKENGFTVDQKNDSDEYTAYNEAAGYKFVKRKMKDFFLSPCIKIQIPRCRSRVKRACFARP